jgi:integrase/recombinase XerC
MTRKLAPYRQSLEPAIPQLPLARRIRRRSFQNELLVEKFDKYLEVIAYSRHTRRSHGAWAKRFGEFLGDRNLAVATKDDVRAFLATLFERNLKPATSQNALFALRCFYKFLELGNQVQTSPPRFVQARKLSRRLPHAKSEAEIERIISEAKTPRDLAIIELAYAAGLRVSELANLRIEYLDLRARSLTVREGKGGKDRVGLFGRSAANALRAYLGDRTKGFVFLQQPRRQQGGVTMDPFHVWWGQWRETDEHGNPVMRSVRLGDCELPTKERAQAALKAYLVGKLPAALPPTEEKGLSTKSIWRIVTSAAKRAGVPGVHPHVFRTSAATHLLNRGLDVRFVQVFLGHDSIQATQKYLAVATANLQATHLKFHPRG